MRSEKQPDGQPAAEATPRSFIEEARRTQIIDCAIDTIAEVGYAGASLSRIAQRAGISKGVISYHFAGKDELIEQVVVHIYAVGGEFMWNSQLKDATGPVEQLRAYISANIEFIATHRKQIAVVTEIFMSFRDKQGRPKYDVAAEEPVFAPLIELLRGGQEAGVFRTFDVRVMALAIRRLIDGTVGELLAHPDTDVSAYIDAAVDLFHHATRK
ncbi:TetR/AcrR family transcriptional regulator [Actinopolymorpha pittospori]|uniref:AcrR family transcriptional regulator n=1 Tax=Actinopolymorpha pittospori TaxID=648752 RepID=A0A927N4S8_9ACTN|nr:TetR/AcrR family transcriptional regulator [Actinopolymorpha pittospori]MBE1612680.1 AcrR family transcriptional regulator [Actinopolymorpha pittospori]